MKTERELFEEAFINAHGGVRIWLNTWSEEDYDYGHLTASWAWQMWQASANREGYKLVPICETCNGYGEVGCQFEGTFTCPDCIGGRLNFKAMIGAVGH